MSLRDGLRRSARRPGLAAATALLAGALGLACGSGRAPDTGGVEPATYRQWFSGRWALDEDVSEDPSAVVNPEAVPDRPDARPGAGGAGDPTIPGGRRGRRRGGAMPRGPDPEALRATLRAFGRVPAEFSLAVDESAVVTTWLVPQPDEGVRLEIAGDGVTTTVNGQPMDTRVEWEGGRLRIERRVARGATVVDLIQPLPDRDRLLVTRRLTGGAGAPPEVRLAFQRVGS